MWRQLWLALHEPRKQTAVFGLAWLLVLALGLVAVSWPPGGFVHRLGPLMTTVWGWLVLIGGALGLIGCPRGWWWLERSGIIAAGTGAVIYIIAVVSMTPPGSRLFHALWVAIVLVGLAARWTMIRGAQLDPRARPSDHH